MRDAGRGQHRVEDVRHDDLARRQLLIIEAVEGVGAALGQKTINGCVEAPFLLRRARLLCPPVGLLSVLLLRFDASGQIIGLPLGSFFVLLASCLHHTRGDQMFLDLSLSS